MKIYLAIFVCCFLSISVQAQTDIEIECLRNKENLVYAVAMPSQLIEQISISNAASKNSFMLGTSTLEEDRILFTPIVPFDEGGCYTLHFYSRKNKAFQQHTFRVGDRSVLPYPKVKNIYPTAFFLPENLLRFYIEFDQPMREDNFLNYIRFIDEKGNDLTGVFLPSRHEYWNRDRTKITLIFDPGRVKTGLIAHESLGGRVLQKGEKYSLIIAKGCLSMEGQPLEADVVKKFEVVTEDMRRINPHSWEINAPRANSKEPVSIDFFRNIDHINAVTHIVILDSNNNKVTGKYSLENNESTLSFSPHSAWEDSKYSIMIDRKLEDVCGNNLIHGFDVYKASELSSKVKEKYIVLEFASKL